MTDAIRKIIESESIFAVENLFAKTVTYPESYSDFYQQGCAYGYNLAAQELAAKDKEIAEQKQKVAGLLKVLKGFVDGYDHDTDAHKYNNLPTCIKCFSQKMIEEFS